MKQFSKVLKFELKYYFKNKIFVGITLFLVLLIAGVMFFPRIAPLFTSADTQTAEEERAVMLVKAADPSQSALAAELFTATFTDYNVQSTEEEDAVICEKITSEEVECAFILTSPTTFTYYVNNLSLYDVNSEIATEVLGQIYQMNAMMESGLSAEEAGDVMNIQITGEVENLGKNQMENFFYTYIMIFALYMVILLYGQMIATNVATEKSSRAMELLITSVSPISMMFGKVIASCIAGFVQLVAVFGSAFLFYNINESYWSDNEIINSIFNIPAELLVFMLVFFVLGYFLYAFMFGAVGSTASKLEDINTSVMPITLLFVIGFMVVMFSMASSEVDNLLMKICSFVPFTSPMAMFTRIAMSSVAWYEIAVSIGILIISTIGIGFLAAKIYRVGVLLYGTKPKFTNLLKSIFKA